MTTEYERGFLDCRERAADVCLPMTDGAVRNRILSLTPEAPDSQPDTKAQPVAWTTRLAQEQIAAHAKAYVAQREETLRYKEQLTALREALTDQIQWVAAFAMGCGQHDVVMESDRMKRALAALAATRKEPEHG